MKLKIISFLFLIGFPIHVVQAQLQKGTWMIGGEASFTSTKQGPRNSALTSIQLNPQLALMVGNRWMVGAGLNLQIIDRTSDVRQNLFFRHYVKSWNQSYFFWGFGLEWRKNQAVGSLSGGPGFRRFSNHLKTGVTHFLNRNVALEAIFNYQLLSITKIPSRNERIIRNNGIASFKQRLLPKERDRKAY